MTESYSKKKKVKKNLSGLHFTEPADEGLNIYKLYQITLTYL